MTFLLFPKLMPELRWQVWLAALDFYTPRVYKFHLDLKLNAPTEIKDAQLIPGEATGCGSYFLPKSDLRWPDLNVSTRMIRALLATCHESRAVALHRFPDMLPFGTIPWDPWRDEEHTRSTSSRYLLPFSSDIDIIALGLSDGDAAQQRIMATWVAGGGKPLLENVCNLALPAGDTSRYATYAQGPVRVKRPWDPPKPPCHCGRSACLSCREDPLLEFLLLCVPRLKTLSFAVLDRGGFSSWAHGLSFELVPRCACLGTESTQGLGEEKGQVGGNRRHNWPMVQFMNEELEWCVWYPEAQTECPFRQLPTLERIREVWLPDWPYYKTLHVEVRVLRCVEIEKGKDELVSGWRNPLYSQQSTF